VFCFYFLPSQFCQQAVIYALEIKLAVFFVLSKKDAIGQGRKNKTIARRTSKGGVCE
jgi:hypothetical protein